MPRRFSGLKVMLSCALIAGGLVLVAAPAQAAAATISLSRTTAISSEYVTVTIKSGQRLKRPVRLQYRDGSTWRTWRTGTTGAKGLKRFTVSTTRTSVVMRAWFPRAKVSAKIRPARASRTVVLRTVRQAVSLQVTKNEQTRTVDASARLTPARSGRRVSLQRRESDGSWRTIVANRQSDARGQVRFPSFARDLDAVDRDFRVLVSAMGKVPSLASSVASVAWPIQIEQTPPELGGDGTPTVLKATTTGPVSSVRFYIDGQEVGRDTQAPWQVDWSPVRGGHDVTARAIGPGGTVLSSVLEFDQPGTTNDLVTGLPAGFSIDTVQEGFTLPTSFAVTDTGRVFVSQKDGQVLTFNRSGEGVSSQPEVIADRDP